MVHECNTVEMIHLVLYDRRKQVRGFENKVFPVPVITFYYNPRSPFYF